MGDKKPAGISQWIYLSPTRVFKDLRGEVCGIDAFWMMAVCKRSLFMCVVIINTYGNNNVSLCFAILSIQYLVHNIL